MDIFDRIAAALTLLAAGTAHTDPAVVSHLEAIDLHLENDDTHGAAIDQHLASLDSETEYEAGAMAVVQAGLQKIADAVSPVPAPAPVAAGNDATATTLPAGGASGTADAPAAATDAPAAS